MKTKPSNSKKQYYFISYSRDDHVRVQEIAHYLKGHRVNLWFDSELQYGNTWSEELSSMIEKAAGLIVVLSPAARDSDWVQRELALADQLGKPIYPILIKPIQRPFLELVRVHYLDLVDGSLPPDEFILKIGGKPHVNKSEPTKPARKSATSKPKSKIIKDLKQCYLAHPDIGILVTTLKEVKVLDHSSLRVHKSASMVRFLVDSAISHERKFLVTSSAGIGYQGPDPWHILIWKISRKKGQPTLISHDECYFGHSWSQGGCAISPDDSKIAAAGDNTIKLIDINSCALTSEFVFESRINRVFFFPQSELAGFIPGYSSLGTDRFVIWEQKSGKVIRELKFEQGVVDVAVHPVEPLVAISSGSRVSFWNTTKWEIVHQLDFHDDVQRASLDPLEPYLVAAVGNALSVLNYKNGNFIAQFPYRDEEVVSCSIADGIVLSAHSSDRLRKWFLPKSTS